MKISRLYDAGLIDSDIEPEKSNNKMNYQKHVLILLDNNSIKFLT